VITLARAVDAMLEATVVGSFSRIGFAVRSRLDHWSPMSRERLDGKVVLVTGATSGLGLAAASEFARMGARVRFLARDRARADAARVAILQVSESVDIGYDLADLDDLAAVDAFATRFLAEHDRLDVLVHNAGALSHEYGVTADGTERTVATHVVAPFLLSARLLPLLARTSGARVVTVSSGGMYSERLDVDDLEMEPGGYDGVKAYARAKRAQVALTAELATRLDHTGVTFHAVHPGWADTPGVATSLPAFRRVTGPVLRTPAEGANTMVWLSVASAEAIGNGGFWHDRRRRSVHHLPWTRRGDEAAERDCLWDCVVARAGVDPTAVPLPPASDLRAS
jgi:NAD(P)-dependent dehydrogenase (short-subunit alcohol dehydrogenase family)